MSDWTSIKDIRKKLDREWQQGKLLATRLTGEDFFPKRLVLKKPQTNEWAEKWDDARAWVAGLIRYEREGIFAIEWKVVNHRKLGRNKFPHAVIFETEESLLRFIGKHRDSRAFDEICNQILVEFPELHGWLVKRPFSALKHKQEWQRLLTVMRFLRRNPRPGIYVRQLKIPDVDTKFVEKHQKILSELFDLILPLGAIDNSAKGVKGFAQRYGFLSKPVQVRFRILDSEQYLHGLSDLHVSVTEFSKLTLDVDYVFITENEINGLAFPDVKRAIIIFGLGFGLDRLAQVEWLRDKNIHYWGDIDTHGFVMLDQVRSYFPYVNSFLMDMDTLVAHRFLWGQESRPSTRKLERLTAREQEVYESLLNNLLSDALRLEQERISFASVLNTLEKVK